MTEVGCRMSDELTCLPKVLDFGRNLRGFQNLEGFFQALDQKKA